MEGGMEPTNCLSPRSRIKILWVTRWHVMPTQLQNLAKPSDQIRFQAG
ncbi:hypothetical protein DVH24_036196 [Malus domestica]|uniref:Uncharacterized protein n=1 Tax=Malus domestica TaxID=3750 RepID=A0A498II88_MALDO|nr:hypothetical protein DVH24_036196 [Malus domestica]